MTAIHDLAQELRILLARVDEVQGTLSSSASKKLRIELESIALDLRTRLTALDPIRVPTAFFDPSDPRLFGTFAAIAMIGQNRIPLGDITHRQFYGSGVYALYYSGPRLIYRAISGTETPIYVGKADPKTSEARSPRDQGTVLARRLDEHRKSIGYVRSLRVLDFSYRHLVVATGYESSAERALISLFRPLWNKETGILRGFGKHGDSDDTRRNKRSPWDVLHPGRPWAQSNKLGDAKSKPQIRSEIRSHFLAYQAIRSTRKVIRALTDKIRGLE